MKNSNLIAATVFGALRDVLESMHDEFAQKAPEEPTADRAFAPGSRAPERGPFVGAALNEGLAMPEAVSKEFYAGMQHAKNQSEERLTAERQSNQDREDLAMHANFRHNAVVLAFANSFQASDEEIIKRSSVIYDFICYGALLPNLGCATTQEIAREYNARMSNMESSHPDYRTVD